MFQRVDLLRDGVAELPAGWGVRDVGAASRQRGVAGASSKTVQLSAFSQTSPSSGQLVRELDYP